MSHHTPGPWRWGFWKWDKETRDCEFRPVNEWMDAWSGPGLVLANCEYGRRVGEPRVERGQLNVIDSIAMAVSSPHGGGEEPSVSIADADMALVAASPKLLAACMTSRSALRLELAARTYDRDTVFRTTTQALDDLDAAIKEAQREAT